MSDEPRAPTRPQHRPKKQDAPLIDWDQLDKLLVYGEVVPAESGPGTAVSYPSYRDLAERFGISATTISEYSKSHNCMRRRERAKLRTQARVEEKVVERRAEAIALSKEEEIEIIDAYLAGFKTALGEGRVRYDSPADYNTMARLKEFLLGGADSRQETHGVLSLEQLQARHREMQRTMTGASPAERGEVVAQLASVVEHPGEREGATLHAKEVGAQSGEDDTSPG